MTTPRLSIIVVGHDMARELPRTVRSLLPPYQRGVTVEDVELIVVDSRSTPPVDPAWFADMPGVQVLRVEDGGLSPCRAVNLGVAASRAPNVAVVIDGARMATPGLVRMSLEALAVQPDAFVATLGFHLGPKVQQVSVTEGYDRDVEDGLLAAIDWPRDGYRLFEICALGQSYAGGALEPPPETTFFVMSRARYDALGGFDERFQTLGGGFANYDFFDRATADPEKPLIMLVGEGTFHQLHYGATTQAGGVGRKVENDASLWDQYGREYETLKGRPYQRLYPPTRLYGALTHPEARRFFFPPQAPQ